MIWKDIVLFLVAGIFLTGLAGPDTRLFKNPYSGHSLPSGNEAFMLIGQGAELRLGRMYLAAQMQESPEENPPPATAKPQLLYKQEPKEPEPPRSAVKNLPVMEPIEKKPPPAKEKVPERKKAQPGPGS